MAAGGVAPYVVGQRTAVVIRVLVADADVELRNGMAALVRRDETLELVAVASDAQEAITKAAMTQPHVAVLDVRMPSGGGVAAARGIREVSPPTSVIALSAADDRVVVLDMLRAGAVRYLVKGALPEEILRAIRASATGKQD